MTFVASTGDYGAADPEYPAFSPDVVAVGGTSLTLNADNSYNSETGWGYDSSSAGAFIGSGGGISLYEPEPAFQQGVQSTGYRTTPDVSMVADPATGAWIADPYNLDPSDPFEVVGGTSLSAPAWAGLVALVDQGRVAAGESTLNSSGPSETQQAPYSLPQADYNVIGSGSNGYNANPGYNLVTGLGTPVAGKLVPDLVAYAGPGTTYPGPTVGPLQDATFTDPGTAGAGTIDVFSVFDALAVTGRDPGRPLHRTPAASPSGGTASHRVPDDPGTSGALHAVAVNTVVARRQPPEQGPSASRRWATPWRCTTTPSPAGRHPDRNRRAGARPGRTRRLAPPSTPEPTRFPASRERSSPRRSWSTRQSKSSVHFLGKRWNKKRTHGVYLKNSFGNSAVGLRDRPAMAFCAERLAGAQSRSGSTSRHGTSVLTMDGS